MTLLLYSLLLSTDCLFFFFLGRGCVFKSNIHNTVLMLNEFDMRLKGHCGCLTVVSSFWRLPVFSLVLLAGSLLLDSPLWSCNQPLFHTRYSVFASCCYSLLSKTSSVFYIAGESEREMERERKGIRNEWEPAKWNGEVYQYKKSEEDSACFVCFTVNGNSCQLKLCAN